MSRFEPIAITGRACVLPGALSPSELRDLVFAGQDAVTSVPEGRWRVSPQRVACTGPDDSADASWSDRGGYVTGFEEVFDAGGFGLPAADIQRLDPLFQWTFHTAREALRDAGITDLAKASAIFGNLSFPSAGLARFAAQVWLPEALTTAEASEDPRQRFSSSYPALLLERALGLGGGATALDAACASSLVAIKYACDRLHERRSDVVLAGAVNAADDLFIHIGFCALQAMSRTGQSRPFNAQADGLVPAEGAGFVVLERLDDALRHGRHIHGVIRGIGLSNDGRGRGLLVPSEEGQVRAIRAAYASSGLEPADISLVECHATGTTVGDGTEIRSMRQVFGEATLDGLSPQLPIGSLKSNLGHLITAAGVAGLIKVTESMAAGKRPPTLHASDSLDELAGSPFRLLHSAEPWESDAPRRAAVSAFGFGGNNAHVIVEQWCGQDLESSPRRDATAQIAVVGLGVVAGDASDAEAFAERWLEAELPHQPRTESVDIDLRGLRFPPNDLKQALGQQLLMLRASADAVGRGAVHQSLATDADLRARTGVLVGMEADPEVARYGARWRLADVLETAGLAGYDAWAAEAREALIPCLQAAGVLGTMPNIPANRLNVQLAVGGSSATFSAGERSGLEALDVALTELRRGDLDMALVGAVDLSSEPVHQAAMAALSESAAEHAPADAAVVLVLERLQDAERLGHPVMAVLETADLETAPAPSAAQARVDVRQIAERFGHARAASGLLAVAGAVVSADRRALPGGSPWLTSSTREMLVEVVSPPSSHRSTVLVRSPERPPSALPNTALPGTALPGGVAPRFRVFDGADAVEVLANLDAGLETDPATQPSSNAARLVIVASDESTLERRRARARRHIEHGAPAGEGVHFRAQPVAGDMAFVFTAAGTSYRGMGRELLQAMPELGDRVGQRFAGMAEAGSWIFDDTDDEPSGLDQLWGASIIAQAHAELSQNLLGLRPDAAIGYSSGESGSLFALGAWTDMDAMRAEIEASGMYDRALGGRYETVAVQWGVEPENVDWQVWALLAPEADVRAAVADEPRVHVAIVHSERDVVIAGDGAGCGRVVARIEESAGRGRCRRLGYDLACHVPEVEGFRDEWHRIHARHVTPTPGVRFYSNGLDAAYQPSTEICASAILAQATGELDFPSTIRRAWHDGVRFFIEHGPQNACSGWIRDILSDTVGDQAKDALIVAFDRKTGGLEQIFEAVAALVAAGVAVDTQRLVDRLAPDSSVDISDTGPRLTLPAHWPAVELPALLSASRGMDMNSRPPVSAQATVPAPVSLDVTNSSDVDYQSMPLAPTLVPILDAARQSAQPVPAAAAPATVSSDVSPEASSEVPGTFAASPEASPEVAGTFTATLEVPGTVAPLTVVPGTAAPLTLAAFETPSPEVPGTLAVSESPSPEVPGTVSASAWSAALARMNHAHQTFIARQAEVHQSYLAQHARQEELILAVAGGGGLLAVEAPTATAVQAAPVQAAPVQAAPVQAAPVQATPVQVAIAALQNAEAPLPPAATSEPPSAASSSTSAQPEPFGPTFSREQLKVHASGEISTIFGSLFAQQDGYAQQVRMPEPPLLLADRVVGLDAEAGSMGTGTIWTETDVSWDSWYLNQGFMPAGVMIEAGQADLMLISYLGVDFRNRGERAYRLLGCQLTYHGDLPRPGETLRFDIHLDGHARQGDIGLMFFHYDCRVDGELRLAVREGQAGFFTEQELADSAGILWRPEEAEADAEARLDAPKVACTRSHFDGEQVRAFADGRAFECFGEGFEFAQTHVRSPSIQTGRMLFLDRVTDFDVSGGPWGRGYLRAEAAVAPDDWFFDGHFKNDPCMPGTLMFEGCLQTMAFYLAGLGFSLERDGWRFQPARGEAFDLRCRGQVLPSSRSLVYEVFVEAVVDGPIPRLTADLLVTCDGQKAFHARRVALELVPDWPLSSQPELLAGHVEPKAVARAGDFEFGYPSLLACAWGRPSDAFGEIYQRFDGVRRVARLPGPPYHFMSRVVSVEGEIADATPGTRIELEYDVPPDAWYFDQNGYRTMPFCVLLEAALQPCGWLASFVGSALLSDKDLSFRNLDGTATWHEELLSIGPDEDADTLRTVVEITGISRSAGMIIESFEVECLIGDRPVYTMKTVFGFFPAEALANQVGLPTSDVQRELLERPSDVQIDLTASPMPVGTAGDLASGWLRLPEPMLLMIDRVTGYWPESGEAGLGCLRAEKDVDPSEWFFKAHFFQDPVQPGSLGLEALVQLLQFYMLERGLGEGVERPRFEPLAIDMPITWKYRGQVVPSNKLISSTVEILEVGRDERGPYAIADGSLWVDGKRIYEMARLGMRIVSGHDGDPGPGSGTAVTAAVTADLTADVGDALVLDPEVDRWLQDHQPTWNRPAVPLMSIADLLAQAALRHRSEPVVELRQLRVRRWLDLDGPRRLRTETSAGSSDQTTKVILFAEMDDGEAEIASAEVVTGAYGAPPEAWPALQGEPAPDPYTSGVLFHGPAFQLLDQLVLGVDGASSILECERSGVPVGALNPALLDAILHGIPHDRLHLWSTDIPSDRVAYPAVLTRLELFGPTPSAGRVRGEVRFDGLFGGPDYPAFRFQLISDGRVWAQGHLVEACFPKGRLGVADPLDRRAFLRDRRFVPGLSLSRHGDNDAGQPETRLSQSEVDAIGWMPGTAEGIYGTSDVELIATREHLARRHSLHPGDVLEALPLQVLDIESRREGADVVISGGDQLDTARVAEHWNQLLGTADGWIGEDLWSAVLQRFVKRVVVADASALARLGQERGAIFLGNHQAQIESLLITNLLPVLTGSTLITMANAKHERGWIGSLLRLLFSYPGARDPEAIVYFDQQQPASMTGILESVGQRMRAGSASFFAHPDGTRSRHIGEPVGRVSSLFLDLALELDVPIVPVRFVGGLPVEAIDGKAEFPVGSGSMYSSQEYFLGAPIGPETLRAVPYGERARRVINSINQLGPGLETEAPAPADTAFTERCAAWREATGASEIYAVFWCALGELRDPGPETLQLIEGARQGELRLQDDAHGLWLAEMARRLYGPRGPRVVPG